MENKQIAILGGFILVGIVTGLLVFGTKNQTKNDNSNLSLNLTDFTKTSIAPSPEITNLKIEDLKLGTGASVKEGDTIAVNYKGMLINGSVFDSTQGKQPLSTQIGAGKVIKGWDEGLLGMKVGGLRRLTIPPSLGYGDQNVGDIPPNSVLIFDIELIRIEEEPSPTASPSSAP